MKMSFFIASLLSLTLLSCKEGLVCTNEFYASEPKGVLSKLEASPDCANLHYLTGFINEMKERLDKLSNLSPQKIQAKREKIQAERKSLNEIINKPNIDEKIRSEARWKLNGLPDNPDSYLSPQNIKKEIDKMKQDIDIMFKITALAKKLKHTDLSDIDSWNKQLDSLKKQTNSFISPYQIYDHHP